MSDSTSLKVVSRHLPLLRIPLLINNLICVILSGFCMSRAIYIAQVPLISISLLAGLFDLIQFNQRKRASRQNHGGADQALYRLGGIAAIDGIFSVILLIVWIIGIIAHSYWDPLAAIIATFGAFIAWSFHSISFLAEVYIWMALGQRAVRKCPNCDYDLSLPAAVGPVSHFQGQQSAQEENAQEEARESYREASLVPSEDAENETDCLILKDGEDKS